MRDCIGSRHVRRACEMSELFLLRFRPDWQDMCDLCRCCQLWVRRRGRILDSMVFFLLILALLGALAVVACLELTPDTHREISQHGDFRF